MTARDDYPVGTDTRDSDGAPGRESRIRGPVAQMIQQILDGADYRITGRTLTVAGVTVDPITDAEFDAAYDAMDEIAMGEDVLRFP